MGIKTDFGSHINELKSSWSQRGHLMNKGLLPRYIINN